MRQALTERQKLIADFKALTNKMVATMEAKNNDYSAGDDAFKNLRTHGVYGILVRKSDKFARLDTFFNPRTAGTEMKVKDESIEDTFLDDATYSLLGVLLNRRLKLETQLIDYSCPDCGHTARVPRAFAKRCGFPAQSHQTGVTR